MYWVICITHLVIKSIDLILKVQLIKKANRFLVCLSILSSKYLSIVKDLMNISISLVCQLILFQKIAQQGQMLKEQGFKYRVS